MRSDERRVYFFDLDFLPRSRKAVQRPNKNVFLALEQAVANGFVKHTVDSSKRRLTIEDINKIDDLWLVLYVKSTDLRGAESSYTNFTTGNVNIHKKASTDGRDFGAHVLIKLEPNFGKRTHLMLIEKSTGINRAHVISLIGKVLRQQYKFDDSLFKFPNASGAKDKTGKFLEISCSVAPELQGHPSDSFKRVLTGDTLKEITLIELEPKSSMGGAAWMEPKTKEITFVPKSNIPAGTIWGAVQSAVKDEKAYDSARIKFHDVESGKQETLRMATDGSILTEKFIKNIHISNISPPLPECCQSIRMDFIGAILKSI